LAAFMNGDFQLAPNLSKPFLVLMEQRRTRFSLFTLRRSL
jgi:hypothetical protein